MLTPPGMVQTAHTCLLLRSWEGHSVTSARFLPQTHHLNQIIRQHKANISWENGTSKKPGLYECQDQEKMDWNGETEEAWWPNTMCDPGVASDPRRTLLEPLFGIWRVWWYKCTNLNFLTWITESFMQECPCTEVASWSIKGCSPIVSAATAKWGTHSPGHSRTPSPWSSLPPPFHSYNEHPPQGQWICSLES